ncbi:unnamed protein product [Mytilus edulis]|uniref:Uncharacterized protein n=1 Tax=Mytilus edulis TaxID=6550 RepID=A0A8S3QP49_MYTED|nr:unnamed protein product [Mytilus edulis]
MCTHQNFVWNLSGMEKCKSVMSLEVLNESILSEILLTFQHPLSVYIVGSHCEGTYTPDHQNDLDILQCDEKGFVIEDIEKADQNHSSLLIVTECYTSPGYLKLQVVYRGIPCTDAHWTLIDHPLKTDIYTLDRSGKIVLFDLPQKTMTCFYFLNLEKTCFKMYTTRF